MIQHCDEKPVTCKL